MKKNFTLIIFSVVLLFFFYVYQNCGSSFESAMSNVDENSLDALNPLLHNEDNPLILSESSLTLLESENLISSKESSLRIESDLESHNKKFVEQLNPLNKDGFLTLFFQTKEQLNFSIFIRIKNSYDLDSEIHFTLHNAEDDQILLKDKVFSFETDSAFQWFYLENIFIQEGFYSLKLNLLTERFGIDQIAISSNNENINTTIDKLEAMDRVLFDSLTSTPVPTIEPTAVPTNAPTPKPTVVPTIAPTATPKPTDFTTAGRYNPNQPPMSTWTPQSIFTRGLGGKNDFTRWPIGTGVNYTRFIRGRDMRPEISQHVGRGTINGLTNVWAIGPALGLQAEHPSRLWVKSGSEFGPHKINIYVPNDYPVFEIPGKPGGEVAHIISDDGTIHALFHPTRNSSGGDRTFKILYNNANARDKLHSTEYLKRVGASASGNTAILGGTRAHELETEGFFITHAFHIAGVRRAPQETPFIMSKKLEYPAVTTDRNSWLPEQNTGPIPYGALMAIRPQDINEVINRIWEVPNVSDRAKRAFSRFAIAHSLYGVMIIDGGQQINYRSDKKLSVPRLGEELIAILRNKNLAWWTWFYYCEGAVKGATAEVLTGTSAKYVGDIGTPTGSATTPHGGGSPITITVPTSKTGLNSATLRGYNGAWNAGSSGVED